MDNLGFNMGMGVQEMFADGIKITLLSIVFILIIHKNVEFFNDRGDTATEIDIVLVNTNSVTLVETKHRFKKKDLERFLEKQYPMFQKYG